MLLVANSYYSPHAGLCISIFLLCSLLNYKDEGKRDKKYTELCGKHSKWSPNALNCKSHHADKTKAAKGHFL